MYIPRHKRKMYGLKYVLKHTPDKFADEVVKDMWINLNKGLNEVIEMCATLPIKVGAQITAREEAITKIKDASFKEILNLSNGKSRYGLGKGIAHSLKALEPYFNQGEKNLIIDQLIKDKECFYTYSRKGIADVLSDFAEPKSDRVFQVLKEFLRVLETETLDKLLAKIDQGADNPDAQKILSKTKKFSFINYDQSEVYTKPEVKIKLVKDIANTTSIAKKLPYILDVSLEDIKKIPPAARLSFLQFAYSPEMYIVKMMKRSMYWYNKFSAQGRFANSIIEQRSAMKMTNLVVPKLSKKDMEDLLFSVSMAKTAETTKWINDYSDCLDAYDGKLKKPHY